MAAAGYPVAFFMPVQHARARMFSDGSAVVQTSTQEFGIGVSRPWRRSAADMLGLPMAKVRVEAGEPDLPNTTSAVGSVGATMVSSAVHAAVRRPARRTRPAGGGDGKSPLHGAIPQRSPSATKA